MLRRDPLAVLSEIPPKLVRDAVPLLPKLFTELLERWVSTE